MPSLNGRAAADVGKTHLGEGTVDLAGHGHAVRADEADGDLVQAMIIGLPQRQRGRAAAAHDDRRRLDHEHRRGLDDDHRLADDDMRGLDDNVDLRGIGFGGDTRATQGDEGCQRGLGDETGHSCSPD